LLLFIVRVVLLPKPARPAKLVARATFSVRKDI
jgi:hypothetical protein